VLVGRKKTLKKSLNAKTKRSATRDLFAELREGIEALAEARARRRTLRTHAVRGTRRDQKHHGGWGAAFNLRKEKYGF
jgi:hypothetical protein